MASILIADDEPIFLELLAHYFKTRDFSVQIAADIPSVEIALSRRSFDVVLLDLFFNEHSSFNVLPNIVRDYPQSLVIIMSAKGTIPLALRAIEHGAETFIAKDTSPQEIVDEVTARLEKSQQAQRQQNLEIADQIRSKQFMLSPVSQRLFKMIDKLSQVDSSILIQGESGSGKEVAARAIHNASSRCAGSFVAINCGAIPESLMEAELFGYKKGAFTDAKTDYNGIFSQSHGGTLFLDEIGEMPLSLQVKLLRVLQDNQVKPLGAVKAVSADFRLIAASNVDLENAVKMGKFRADLYYRLAVIKLNIPPLRQRLDEIPDLVQNFILEFSSRYHKKISFPNDSLLRSIINYSWPGNIRELRNAIERGVVLAEGSELNLEDMIPKSNNMVVQSETVDIRKTFEEARRDFEQKYLEGLLAATGGNVTEMAKISGRYRTDIYRLLLKHGIDKNSVS